MILGILKSPKIVFINREQVDLPPNPSSLCDFVFLLVEREKNRHFSPRERIGLFS